MLRHKTTHLVFAALVAAIVGCDSSAAPYVEGSQDEATVKGTIKVKGKLMPGGTIHFNASNSKRIVPARDARIGPDGSFSLKAYVGQNIVTVSPPRKNRTEIKNRDYFGLEYADKYVEIKAGEDNLLDIDLTP